MASTSSRSVSILRSALSSPRLAASTCSSAASRVASSSFSSSSSSTRSFSLLPRLASRSRTPLASSSRLSVTPQLSRSLFVQTQTTPNPNSLQFIPGTPVLSSGGTHEFLTPQSSLASPLATRLMAIQGVLSVFYGPDFVSVQKDEDTPWSLIKPEVFSHIMEHFSSGKSLFREGSKESSLEEEDGEPEDTRILDTDSEVVAMIKDLLASRIRPSIMEDGGDLEYKGFDEREGGSGLVTVRLKGSCRGCSSSAITLKSGIERMLMHYVPEVKGVEQLVDEEELVALDEFTKFEAKLAAKQAAAASA